MITNSRTIIISLLLFLGMALTVCAKEPTSLKELIVAADDAAYNNDFQTVDNLIGEIANYTSDSTEIKVWQNYFKALEELHNDKDNAIIYLQEIQRLQTRENHPVLAGFYNAMGIYHMRFDDFYLNTMLNFRRALDYLNNSEFDRSWLKHIDGYVQTNIAESMHLKNDYSYLKFLDEAREIAQKTSDINLLARAEYMAMRHAILTDRKDIAESKFDYLENLAQKSNLLSKAQVDALRILRTSRNGNTAIILPFINNNSILDSLSVGDRCRLYIELSGAALNNKKIDLALEIGEKALLESKLPGGRRYLSAVSALLGYCYGETGQYEKAYKYLFEHEQLQAIKYLTDMTDGLFQARSQMEVYSRDREIQQQKIELLSKRNTILWISAACILLIIVVSLLAWHIHKRAILYRAIVDMNKVSVAREKILTTEMDELRKNISDKQDSSSDRTNSLISQFEKLMNEEKYFSNPEASLADAAERLATNRTYLSQAINSRLGMSFPQALSTYRINYAISLMGDLTRNLPLKAIASEAGFGSTTSFYTTFQKTTGMSPASYRSILQKQQFTKQK